jgi:hypothetical protein
MTKQMKKREHVMNNINETLMKQQAKNFYVEIDASGEEIYHWIDTRVDMLSSSKLWSILSLYEESNANLDTAFTEAITNELVNRNDFDSGPILRIQ